MISGRSCPSSPAGPGVEARPRAKLFGFQRKSQGGSTDTSASCREPAPSLEDSPRRRKSSGSCRMAPELSGGWTWRYSRKSWTTAELPCPLPAGSEPPPLPAVLRTPEDLRFSYSSARPRQRGPSADVHRSKLARGRYWLPHVWSWMVSLLVPPSATYSGKRALALVLVVPGDPPWCRTRHGVSRASYPGPCPCRNGTLCQTSKSRLWSQTSKSRLLACDVWPTAQHVRTAMIAVARAQALARAAMSIPLRAWLVQTHSCRARRPISRVRTLPRVRMHSCYAEGAAQAVGAGGAASS